jgi:TIR domain
VCVKRCGIISNGAELHQSIMKVFISHITEEAPIAQALKDFIEARLLGQVLAFASTDVHDLTPGDPWLQKIAKALSDSQVFLVICSPASLTRPWINFEAGGAWFKGIPVIPICHSGQRKDQLPFPFSALQALQLEDPGFGKALLHALCTHFQIPKTPEVDAARLRKKIEKATAIIAAPDASPQIIHDPRERTKLINDDLRALLKTPRVAHETVWTSAFLSTLAIGPDDPYPVEDQDYLGLLLEERELLLSLARKGCTVKCIISPANKNYIRHAGIDYAIKRTNRLIRLIGSRDLALDHIEWALSELGTKNLYIIGHLSCFEGYKKGIHQGYGLTLRQTSRDVISANIDLHSRFFRDLAARTIAQWTDKHDPEASERELIRIAAIRCLTASSKFLTEFSHGIKRKVLPAGFE